MKKLVCILSMCLVFVSLFGLSVFADYGTTPSITIAATSAQPGDTIQVKFYLENNPGIVSAKLDFDFDDKLTLISAANGDAFSPLTYMPPKQLEDGSSITSRCQFVWQGFDIENDQIKDGAIITLTFLVAEDAQVGDSLNVYVSNTRGNVVDKA